jgi:hypothetical protein
MRIVAAGRRALSRIGGVLLSNLTNQGTTIGLGYKRRTSPWKQQACFAEAKSIGRFLTSSARLDGAGYPKSAPPGCHSPSAERKFL